jgi:hypothetical protein
MWKLIIIFRISNAKIDLALEKLRVEIISVAGNRYISMESYNIILNKSAESQKIILEYIIECGRHIGILKNNKSQSPLSI